MLCILEILCIVYGIITLVKGKFPVGKTKEVRGVPAYLIGLILLSVIPVAVVVAIIMNWDDIAQGKQPDPFKFEAKNVLPDVIGVFGCGGLALVIALMTAKPKEQDRRQRDYDDYDDDRPRRIRDDYDDRPRRRRDDYDDADDRPRRRDDLDDRAR